MKLKLRLLFICLGLSSFAFSQNYIFKQFSTDHGLPDKYIYSMVQDKEGFLWISTASGLVSFDGQIFKKEMKIKSGEDFIYSSAIDRENNLWFGTFTGKLFIRDAATREFSEQNLNTGAGINKIIASANSSLVYLVCKGNGVYSMGKNKQLKLLLKTDDYLVNDLKELDGDRLLLSTSEGLMIYSNANASTVKLAGFNSETGLLQAYLGKKNVFWVNVPGKGLFRIGITQGNDVNVLTSLDGIPELKDVAYFFLDEEINSLFITNANERLSLLDLSTNRQRLFGEDDYFGATNFIFKGRQKNLWVCTNGKGLYRLHRAEYDLIPLGDEAVYAIAQDDVGNMYYGTKTGVLVTNSQNVPLNPIEQLDGKKLGKVTSLFFDAKKLWIGTESQGLFVIDPKTGERTKMRFSDIENIGVNSITGTEGDPRVQVNTNLDGAYLYDRYELLINFSVKNSLLHNNVYHSIRMKNNKVYYATHNTAFNFSTGDKLYEINVRDNDLITDFNVFAKNSKEQLFVATDGDGVYAIEDSVIRPLDLGSKLESKYVTGLVFDLGDNLWIQQQYNLYEYYPDEKIIRKVNFYNRSQMLFNPQAFYRNRWGDLFFGCNHGVVKFNHNTNISSINFALAYITAVKINDSLMTRLVAPELKNGKYNVVFEYSALGQKNSEDISFRYILEGRDNNWSEPTKQKRVEFSNLGEGNYTFKLEAINSDGFVQKEMASYSFTINRPLWKHTWFWLLLGFLIIVSVLLIINWRTAKLRKAKIDLERTVQEKTLEIRKEKDIVEKNSRVIESQNTDIKQSINYAKRIQEAILPVFDAKGGYVPEMFIIYLPKDIVSGDFYWHAIKNDRFLLAACDCTGHGVPGAFMSLIGSTLLNKIVVDKGIVDPHTILREIDIEISVSLKQESNEVRDGMEAAVCSFDFKNSKLYFSGSKRPLWVFSKKNSGYEFAEYGASKYPIGGFADVKEKNFATHEIPLAKGDLIYMFTDGITDQLDAENKRRLSLKRMREFLAGIVHLSFEEQDKEIRNVFNNWKQNTRQTDDVMFIGIRI